MARYEKAAAVRNLIADQILDGRAVVSVGIRGSGDNCSVGVTVTRPVDLPELSDEFSDVDVQMNVIGSVPEVQNREKLQQVVDSALGSIRAEGLEPSPEILAAADDFVAGRISMARFVAQTVQTVDGKRNH